MTAIIKVTSKWTTICTVGYTGSVSRNENRAAHGAVCHCQARRTPEGKIIGRKVNSNGRHQEVGESFDLTDAQLANWEYLGRRQ